MDTVHIVINLTLEDLSCHRILSTNITVMTLKDPIFVFKVYKQKTHPKLVSFTDSEKNTFLWSVTERPPFLGHWQIYPFMYLMIIVHQTINSKCHLNSLNILMAYHWNTNCCCSCTSLCFPSEADDSIYVTHSVKMRLFCAHGQNLSSWYIIKVYILPFIMVRKVLKLNNANQSYGHLTFGVLKSMKQRNRLSKFGVYHWVNCQFGQKSSKLYHLDFKFWS